MSSRSQRTTTEAHRASPATRTAMSEDTPDRRLLKREAVAEMVGASVSTVRRLEKTLLPPVIIKGVRYQREQDVREHLQRTRGAGATADAAEGSTASDAFELFESGLGPADVVRRLRIGPQAVRLLHREWADLRGGFVFGGEAAAKLERIPWLTGCFPVTSGDELVAMLAENAPDECRICKERPPQFCGRCAVARPSWPLSPWPHAYTKHPHTHPRAHTHTTSTIGNSTSTAQHSNINR